MNPEDTPKQTPGPNASQQDASHDPLIDPNISQSNSARAHDDPPRTPEHRPASYHFEHLSYSPE
jgi:hypothetical protein